MKCWQCETENPEGSVYCTRCGAELLRGGVRPIVKTKQTLSQVSRTIPPPGMCFYHPNIASKFVCSKCGRSICEDCTQKISGLVFCVMCAPSIEKPEWLRFTGILMILVGALHGFFVFSMLRNSYFGIWAFYNVFFVFAFVICGWQLTKMKKWAAIGGALSSVVGFAVILYYYISPFFRYGLFFSPIWILLFILWILLAVVAILIAVNWSKIR